MQLCIKVFNAVFVCVRRNGAGCPVLRALSATMGKYGAGTASTRERSMRERGGRSAESWSLHASAHQRRPPSRRCKKLSVCKRWTKCLLCRVARSQKSTIRMRRRRPAHRMQRAASATSVTPRPRHAVLWQREGSRGFFINYDGERKQTHQTRVDDVGPVKDVLREAGHAGVADVVVKQWKEADVHAGSGPLWRGE